jgi:hypothetical protein
MSGEDAVEDRGYISVQGTIHDSMILENESPVDQANANSLRQ